jgi:hypothetical protein
MNILEQLGMLKLDDTQRKIAEQIVAALTMMAI